MGWGWGTHRGWWLAGTKGHRSRVCKGRKMEVCGRSWVWGLFRGRVCVCVCCRGCAEGRGRGREEETINDPYYTRRKYLTVHAICCYQLIDWKCINMSFVKVLVAQSCPTLCDPVDGSPLGSSVHGILQARMLECITIPFSRGSSQPKDWTLVSCIAARFFIVWATREAYVFCYPNVIDWRRFNIHLH